MHQANIIASQLRSLLKIECQILSSAYGTKNCSHFVWLINKNLDIPLALENGETVRKLVDCYIILIVLGVGEQAKPESITAILQKSYTIPCVRNKTHGLLPKYNDVIRYATSCPVSTTAYCDIKYAWEGVTADGTSYAEHIANSDRRIRVNPRTGV